MKSSSRFTFPLAAMLVAGTLFATPPQAPRPRRPGVYAVLDTTMGTIVLQLLPKLAPATVENFTGLAEGTKEWMTPLGKFVKQPYYDGVIFHRVIKGFMVQAGDVTRSGNFTAIPPFQDEISPSLRFDAAGVLAMANSGPNTNRTQFFITVSAQPHLNGKHTIFGRVVEGLDVVMKISEVPTVMQRPGQDVTIRKVTIERVAKPSR
jgi:peptidyl-prolyl cis-trans isomerase A (cyclophilin A)